MTSVYAGIAEFQNVCIGMSDSADFGALATFKVGRQKPVESPAFKKVFDGSIQSIVDATAGYKAVCL